MPKGINDRKKKKLKQVNEKKTKPTGRHYNRVVYDDIVTTPTHVDPNVFGTQPATVDYEKLYRDLKKDMSIQRYQILNDWMKSVATINDAIAHAIGEIGGAR